LVIIGLSCGVHSTDGFLVDVSRNYSLKKSSHL